MKDINYKGDNAQILLDNVDEGLLLFDDEYIIEAGYSKECLAIFNKTSLDNIDIRDLLFSDNGKDKNTFEMAIQNILETSDLNEKNLYLTFLPSTIKFNDKTVQLKYRTIHNVFMLIAVDITAELKLEEELIRQRKIQDMIVSVASNIDEFLDIKSDFIKFLESLEDTEKCSMDEMSFITRTLHTYKGIFLQKDMLHITDAIHNMELDIRNNGYSCLNPFMLQLELTKDIKLLSKVLGEDSESSVNDFNDMFFDFDTTPEVVFNINEYRIDNLYNDLSKYIDEDTHNIVSLNELRLNIKSFKDILLHDILSGLKDQAKKTAFSLKKDINPLIIEESSILVPPVFKPFLQTLVHIINNSIDHGIETLDRRLELNKNPLATITCNYRQINNKLIIEIADDGSGIDIDKLESKILKNNVCCEEEINKLSNKEKCNLIFLDHLSTKDDTSEISGMGIGMSSVKAELNKLNGTIDIDNIKNKGVKFTITIPLKKDKKD